MEGGEAYQRSQPLRVQSASWRCVATPGFPSPDRLLTSPGSCRNGRFRLDSWTCCPPSRYLRHGRRRRRKAAGRGDRHGSVQGAREGRLGRAHGDQGRHHESLCRRKSRRADRGTSPRQGLAGVRPFALPRVVHLNSTCSFYSADETPKIGPSVPNASSAPSEPSGFISGATISGAPQPHQSNAAYSQPQYQSYTPSSQPSQQPYGLPIAGLPARPLVSNPGEALPLAPGQYANVTQPSVQTGAGRSADGGPEGEPNAKRQRVPKRTDGSFWPEEEWLSSHPVRRFHSLFLTERAR